MAYLNNVHVSYCVSFPSINVRKGADDVDQLVDLTPEEFQQLCSMIGMDKKPFHVLRLKKALEKKQQPPPSASQPSREQSPLLYSLPAVTPANSKELSAPSINNSFPQPNPVVTSTKYVGPIPLLLPVQLEPQVTQETQNKSFLPPYLQSDSLTSDFSALVDYQTQVQCTLGPPPCNPKTWNKKRKAIIKQHASFFHKDNPQKESLSQFQQHINEAAFQLCLRDPTLIVRRNELFLLSERALQQGQYHHGNPAEISTPTKPAIGQKRSIENRSSSTPQDVAVNPLAKRQYTDLKQKLSTRERLSRMNTLKAEMEANVAFQKVKIVAMEEAKNRGDVTTSQALQEHVKSLGAELQQLEGAHNILKRKQNRSDRYFRIKGKKSTTEEQSLQSDSGSAQDQLSPIDSVLLSPAQDMQFETPSVYNFPTSSSNGEERSKRASKRKATPKKLKAETSSTSNDDPSESEIKNLVDNVSNATDQVNSILSREEMNW